MTGAGRRFSFVGKFFWGNLFLGQLKNTGGYLARQRDGQNARGGIPGKAGVRVGDILYEVDGVDVTDMNLDEVVSLVRGEENTMVNIVVLRGEKKEKVEMDITREKIQSQTVQYEMKE